MGLPGWLAARALPVALYRVLSDSPPAALERLGTAVADRPLPPAESRRLGSEIVEHLHRGRRSEGVAVFSTGSKPYPGVGVGAICDIAVLAARPGEAETLFRDELRRSEARRRELVGYLEHSLRPFLARLESEPLVASVVVRGDFLVPDRYPTEPSDIDVLVLSSIGQDDARHPGLRDLLATGPGSFRYGQVTFGGGGYRLSTGGTPGSSDELCVEYTVIPVPELLAFARQMALARKEVPGADYFRSQGDHAVIVFDKSGIGKALVRWLRFGPRSAVFEGPR